MIFYGDTVTESMRRAIEETARRRHIQEAYNIAHGITPESIRKSIPTLEYATAELDYVHLDMAAEEPTAYKTDEDITQLVQRLEVEMKAAAKKLEFERAAELRNRIRALKLRALELAQ